MAQEPINLFVALDGTGWHPSSWRDPDARPLEFATAKYWKELAQTAERGLIDAITLEDSLGLQSERPFENDARTDQFRGRLDAVQVATFIVVNFHTLHMKITSMEMAANLSESYLMRQQITLKLFVDSGIAGKMTRRSVMQKVASSLTSKNSTILILKENGLALKVHRLRNVLRKVNQLLQCWRMRPFPMN